MGALLAKGLGWITGASLWIKLGLVVVVAGSIFLGAKALHGSIYNSGVRFAEAKCEAAKWKTAYESLQKSQAELKRRTEAAEDVTKNATALAQALKERNDELEQLASETPASTSKCLSSPARDRVQRIR